jgi:hypothetical protein
MKGRFGLTTFGAALACAGLFGCGGGGGGGDSGLPQPPSTPITISASNIGQVTDAALDPAVGGTGAFGATSSVDAPQSNPGALVRAMQTVSRQAKQPRSGSSGLSDVPINETCPFGGTITGDETATSATIRFNACSFEQGEVINGSVSVTGVVNNPPNFSANFNVDITFTVSGSQPLRLVGAFSISEVCDSSGVNCTSTFHGPSLGAAHGAEVWFISNFSIMAVDNSGNLQITASYIVASNQLNGAVTVSTTSTIEIASTALYPHAGVIQVIGANNTRAVITISSAVPVDTNAVLVEVDTNGDGGFEHTTSFSWNQLEAI